MKSLEKIEEINELDEGIYGKNSDEEEKFEPESVDDFVGILDIAPDTAELFCANDYGKTGFGDKNFVTKADRTSAEEISKKYEKLANKMLSDDLFK